MAQKKRNYKVTNAHRSRALSMRVDRTLRAHGITPTNQSITQVSAQQFHAAISTGKQQAKHGWMVDVHTVKEYRGMRCYLTADGKSGIAIKRDEHVCFSLLYDKLSPKGKMISKLLYNVILIALICCAFTRSRSRAA